MGFLLWEPFKITPRPGSFFGCHSDTNWHPQEPLRDFIFCHASQRRVARPKNRQWELMRSTLRNFRIVAGWERAGARVWKGGWAGGRGGTE